MKHDPNAFYAYPSSGNFCFHCKPRGTPLLAHQETYCLALAHTNCPVYQQTVETAFPSEYEHSDPEHSARPSSARRFLFFFIGLVVLGFVGSQFFPRLGISPLKRPSQTAAPVQPSETSVTPTVTPLSTPSAIPSATSLPQAHALEVSINVGGREFLIHRVLGGDTFEMVAAAYKTTPVVIRSLNYSMKPSLQANSLIVISPGLQTVDPSLPPFRTYEVAEQMTIEQLAAKLNVDATLLRRYNGCAQSCNLAVGDWLIVPVSN
jgi:LysM repeat protein